MKNWEQVFYIEKGNLCYYSSNGKPYTGGGIASWVDDMKIPINGGDMQDVVLVEFIGEPYGSYGYIKENLRLATQSEIDEAQNIHHENMLKEINKNKSGRPKK